jgi:hypothetical protein
MAPFYPNREGARVFCNHELEDLAMCFLSRTLFLVRNLEYYWYGVQSYGQRRKSINSLFAGRNENSYTVKCMVTLRPIYNVCERELQTSTYILLRQHFVMVSLQLTYTVIDTIGKLTNVIQSDFCKDIFVCSALFGDINESTTNYKTAWSSDTA